MVGRWRICQWVGGRWVGGTLVGWSVVSDLWVGGALVGGSVVGGQWVDGIPVGGSAVGGFVIRCVEKVTTPNIFLALFSLIEKWKNILDDKGFVVAVLMDLSKAFDTLNHKLLIAKLHPYGFKRDSLKLINDYLSNRRQRAKINKNFSSWAELIQGVPQGSVLSPLLLNIYFNDLFCLAESTEVYNFANDTTSFACNKDLKTLITSCCFFISMLNFQMRLGYA